MTNRPDKLARLAGLSRARYIKFYESALAAIRGMFIHPKLTDVEQKHFHPGVMLKLKELSS